MQWCFLSRTSRVLTSSAVLTAAAWSSQGVVAGPSLGHFLDPQIGAIRPIQGILGSARLGPLLDLDQPVSLAEVDPNQRYVLVRGAPNTLLWLDLRTGAPEPQPIALSIASVDRIAIAPTGAYAIAVDSHARRAQRIDNLPGGPRAARIFAFDEVGGPVRAIAIADDGETLLIASANALFSATPSGPVTRHGAVGRVTSMSFLPGRDAALVADYQNDEILLVQDVSGPSALSVLASEADGIERPIAVRGDQSLDQAIVATAENDFVTLIPLSGGPASRVRCACRPVEIAPLQGGSLYRLTNDSSEPLFVLDTGRKELTNDVAEPRILFVPGDPSVAAPPGASAHRPVRARRMRR